VYVSRLLYCSLFFFTSSSSSILLAYAAAVQNSIENASKLPAIHVWRENFTHPPSPHVVEKRKAVFGKLNLAIKKIAQEWKGSRKLVGFQSVGGNFDAQHLHFSHFLTTAVCFFFFNLYYYFLLLLFFIY